MQIKFYTIPIMGGELLSEEMNVFLRSKKVLQVENQLISQPQGACWCFCIKYLDDIATADKDKPRVNYRQVLDEATFKRFTALRDIRKRVSETESLPAYIIFTDDELALMAKMETITPASLKTVKGIGEKKIEKYGHYFLQNLSDEKI